MPGPCQTLHQLGLQCQVLFLSADTVSALGAVSCGEERDVITDVICKQFQVAV